VTALRPGTDTDAKLVVVSAHIDTVFPEGTPVEVRREGTRLYAPGVRDDTRGLATLLAYAGAMNASEIATRHPILFVGTVGEEGRGDLRGVRYLFTQGAYKDRIGAFFSINGNNAARVTHGGVGSKRYHVAFSGPGGHSWGAFGTVNPMTAMADADTQLYRIEVPAEPRTSYSASVTAAGARRAGVQQLLRRIVFRWRSNREQLARKCETGLTGSAGEQAIVPDAVEAGRQHME